MKPSDEMYYRIKAAAITGILANPNIETLLGTYPKLDKDMMQKINDRAAHMAAIVIRSDESFFQETDDDAKQIERSHLPL